MTQPIKIIDSLPMIASRAAVFCCILLLGCQAPPSTNQERQASFQVNSQLFRGNIQEVGSAVYHLLSVDSDLESISMDAITGKLTAKFSSDRHFSETLCVGIAQDGYFITAAHAAGKFCYIIGEFDGKTGVHRSRIVEKASAGSPGSDFAILKTESTIHWLRYSRDVVPDENVFAVVFSKGGEIGGGLDFAAGKVKEIQPDPLGYPARLIDSSVPLRAGDSGGPLFNAAGELIGITQGWQIQRAGLAAKYRRWSCRPDWQILNNIIEKDRDAQSSDRKPR